MDDNNSNNSMPASSGNSLKKFAIPAAIVVIIFIAAISFYASRGSRTTTQLAENKTPTPTEAMMPDVTQAQTSPYTDGTYEVTGNYVSPGGPREIGVTLTLVDGIITEAVFEGRAEDPTSMRFQGEFGNNFKPMVIGKNIDEVALTKVSGSSLTPKGFNDAVEKIKGEATTS